MTDTHFTHNNYHIPDTRTGVVDFVAVPFYLSTLTILFSEIKFLKTHSETNPKICRFKKDIWHSHFSSGFSSKSSKCFFSFYFILFIYLFFWSHSQIPSLIKITGPGWVTFKNLLVKTKLPDNDLQTTVTIVFIRYWQD